MEGDSGEEDRTEDRLHQALTSLLGALLCPAMNTSLFVSFSEIVQISLEVYRISLAGHFKLLILFDHEHLVFE